MSSSNSYVNQWVAEQINFLKPDKVQWIDGSDHEYANICDRLVEQETFIPLNAELYPNSYWSRSHPSDVARVESRTFVCSRDKIDAGPTNNWLAPQEMKAKLQKLMSGCMHGRTLYVVPYMMGPEASPYSKIGFELTDSLYVVANLRIMARVGNVALQALPDDSTDFVKGVHSLGKLDPEQRYIVHYPEERSIVSFNTGYGGNALQCKKCFALRIASVQARDEGWLAEHMLIMGITNPEGVKKYFCAAFPSACGKTNLAMLIPPKEYADKGWKIETVGDDIAWLNFGSDGRLYAINPEAGFFGVAPGTSYKTNPNAMATIAKGNTIFTNTALNLDNYTPWWEGIDQEPPKHTLDWLGREWNPSSKEKAAHPNSRFTSPAKQCPVIDPDWESPMGVPISAIIFGGRRRRAAPLVYQARNWQHGTFVGLTMASETTAAAAGAVGQLRRDPMAMLPFIGYNVGDYIKHWLAISSKAGAKLPEIFHVNWFKQDQAGKFLWPGFGENIRVLEWIFKRVDHTITAEETSLGFVPKISDLNLKSLNLASDQLQQLLEIIPDDWIEDLKSQKSFFKTIGDKLPEAMWLEHNQLVERLKVTL